VQVRQNLLRRNGKPVANTRFGKLQTPCGMIGKAELKIRRVQVLPLKEVNDNLDSIQLILLVFIEL
jgi:hypothetical protein